MTATRHPRRAAPIAIAPVLLLAGCSGTLSALDPAGRDAARIHSLFLWMLVGSLVLWLGVSTLAIVAPRLSRRGWLEPRRLIVAGGVILPLAVLMPLLAYGLAAIPRTLAPGAQGLSIEVTGQQWWWRVRYVTADGTRLDLANELYLPVDRRTTVRLTSADVVHSFWVPSLAGKMDMIPGRRNELALEPTRTGTFRGVCAEFCGTSHARMHLTVHVVDAAAFSAWLAEQAAPAAVPVTAAAEQGRQSFLRRGCVVCHTVRGTIAAGVTGPDLTHVGSRATIAAGQWPLTAQHVRDWIAGTELLKPDARMPAFAHLPDGELAALAAYVMALR